MSPNRQLDVRVAEKIFGQKVVLVKALEGYKWDSKTPVISEYPVIEEHGVIASQNLRDVVLNLVPFYSFELDAAMEIVYYMVEKGWVFSLKKLGEDRYLATFNTATAGGDTIPLAICLAALKAVDEN